MALHTTAPRTSSQRGMTTRPLSASQIVEELEREPLSASQIVEELERDNPVPDDSGPDDPVGHSPNHDEFSADSLLLPNTNRRRRRADDENSHQSRCKKQKKREENDRAKLIADLRKEHKLLQINIITNCNFL